MTLTHLCDDTWRIEVAVGHDWLVSGYVILTARGHAALTRMAETMSDSALDWPLLVHDWPPGHMGITVDEMSMRLQRDTTTP